jgi:hypothetical protein
MFGIRVYLGSIRHSCKKLQAAVEACPEIIQFAVFVHIINPTGFFVYDFDCFSRSKSTYRRTDGKRMIAGQFRDRQVSPAQMLVFIVI